ncbi:FAD-dependent monooxygenase [Salinibacterium sp. ZJ454]|uniref:FAD-dependent monooxygenase n=1 Tax=Salinibacterium sp. ZJ454 TaxID=2708339 RepID=UPI0014243A27|nr:FAD-dependent monooxygenase [Salinibacterium sp. ZJ454]
MSTTTPEVLVVGGGIGGLATAFVLRRSGVTVTLVERAAEFGEVGAGLQLGPNATRILDDWGLLENVKAIGVVPHNLVVRDAITNEELTRQELLGDFAERYGAPYVVAHRSDLHTVFLNAARDAGVTLVTSEQIDRVETVGDRAIAHAVSGKTWEVDAVIAADGLRSALRAQISDDAPVASGYVAYRGTCPIDEVPELQHHDDVVVWVGPGCHFVQYPLRGGEVLNQVAVFQSPAFERGEAEWGGPEELEAAYKDCVEPIREGLEHIWKDRQWQMYDREPIGTWVQGRMVLVGDAAHPMLQYLAQGACQAIEDAEAIGRAVANHVLAAQADNAEQANNAGWPAALEEFAAERTVRTAQVQRSARKWGASWHVDGAARVARNALYKGRNPHSYEYLDWIYAERNLAVTK